MTVESATASASYTGNGSTTAFTVPFYFLVDTDIQISQKVAATGVTSVLALNSDYTLAGAGDSAGGTATLAVAPAVGDELYIERNVVAVQETAYPSNSPFPASSHEKALDRLTMLIQQVLNTLTFGLFRNPLSATYDAGGNTITNVADAVNPNDVPSLQQVTQAIAAAQITPSVPAADIALLSNLASTISGKGAALIGFIQSGAGAVAQTVLSKLRLIRTVEDWGAKGDGVTNDAAAFLAMAAATGGLVRMREAEYFVGNLVFPDSTSIVIEGAGAPVADSGLTKLAGGSVLIGGVSIRANQVRAEGFGLDAGTGRGITTGTYDGLVINALTGQQGVECHVRRVACMGADGTTTSGTSHAVLVQGYSRGSAHDIYCAQHQFGLVIKCHNFVVSDVAGDYIRTALVYPKSDTPDVGGNVLDASAANVEISNVQYRPATGNAEGSAVYLHGSTLPFNSARVSNVSALYGHSAVRIQGGGSTALTCGSIAVNNISAERTQYAVYAGGYTYDWVAVGIRSTNPATGAAVYMDTTTTNWGVFDVNHLVTDSGITGSYAFLFYGTGQWNGLSVRNPYVTQLIKIGSLANIRTGTYAGNVAADYEGALVGINGATAGTPAPTLKILAGSVLKLSGRFSLTGSTNKVFCNIPNIGNGNDMIFAGGYIDSASAYQSCAIRLASGFQLSIEPSLPSGAKFVDISGITIPA